MWRTDSLEIHWCWERLKEGGEGDDRRWDGWMASLTHWTWVWVGSGNWWWTRKPGMLQSMGSQSRTRLKWLSSSSCKLRAIVYDSWTIKKAEHWRIDAFKLWCWRKLLTVPWTVRRWNQSILKEINPEYSTDVEAEATCCEEGTYWERHWCWERLKAKGEDIGRGCDGWIASAAQ